MGEYEPRNFIQPCLLLLLRERSDHGYDLVDRLRELHAVDGDAGVVYRALRSLEKAGMVRSCWQASDSGPARRTYQVTQLGMATLDRQADILEETHRTLHLFQLRYQRLACGADGCVGPGFAADALPGDGRPAGRNGQLTGNGFAGSRTVAGAAVAGGAAGNGAVAGGAAGNGAVGNGTADSGVPANGRRRYGNDGTPGGAADDHGGRGVRPPRPPSQRTGR